MNGRTKGGEHVDRTEFFAKLPRTEPGGALFTSAYLTQISIKPKDHVLDIGCAAGDRATWIARSRGTHVFAVDREPRYVAVCRSRAEEGGAAHLVHPIVGDYGQLPFRSESFKVVMAEGAAMGLGLKQALTLWRRLVPVQGHICVSYPGVVNSDAPAEVRQPLERRMVERLGTLADYHTTARSAGYEVVHQVALQNALWDMYHAENIRRAWALVKSGGAAEDDPAIKEVLADARWFRTVGRGRVFMQALVLRRLR